MKSLQLCLCLPAACLLAQAPPPKPVTPKPNVTMSVENPPEPAKVPPDKVVISVGDEKITAGQLDRMIDVLPEQVRGAARGPGRRQFAENIVKLKVLAHEARKHKLDQTDSFKTQAAFQQDNLLATLFYQNLANTVKIDEADSRKYYEQHKSEYERVKARHILIRMKGSPVPTKPEQKDLSEQEALAKAQEIRKKLVAGADFAALARAESDDSGSGSNGGELGFFQHGQMVPSFEQAAFALPVGQVSEPVKSQFGYHLIQVEQKEAKTFDELRPELEKKLRPEAAQRMLEELRKQTPVTLDPTYFGGK